MVNVGIIIQARTDSSRLPNKVLELIDSESVLWHVINRCKKTPYLVIVSTTNREIDEPIIEICKKHSVDYFRGSSEDVLDRFYQTAKNFSIDVIIRVTADCPLVDPQEIEKVAKSILVENFDYSGIDENTYPDGFDCEAFTFNVLEKTWKDSKLQSEREHVTPYMKNPKNMFKRKFIPFKKNYSNFRFSIDYIEDLMLIQNLMNKLNENFSIDDVLEILNKNPELVKINNMHKRNEGYAKSLKNDKLID